MSATGELLVLEAVAQQDHSPPAGAHLVLLAGLLVTGVVLLAVMRWRRRRDEAAAPGEQPSSDHLSPGSSSKEDE
jgi:hypothetical protein